MVVIPGLKEGSQRRAGLAIVIALLAGVSCAGVGRSSEGTSRPSTFTPPAEGIVDPRVQTLDIGHSGGVDVEVGHGAVWVSTMDGVLRVDPTTNAVVDEIPLEGAFDLDLGDDALWVTNTYEGTLSRIDPVTLRVTEPVDLGLVTPYCVDATASAVWVTGSGDDGGDVIRIDPVTNDVVARTHIEPGEGTGGIGCVVADDSTVWVTRGGKHDSLLRIDAQTNEVVAIVDIANPDYWNEMVLEAGVLWVATAPHVRLDDGTKTGEVRLLRVDPATDAVADPILIGGAMPGIGAGEGSVWMYTGDGVAQVDPTTSAIVRRIPIPDTGSSWGGDPGIDAGDGTVWMAGTYALNRIDPS
jgi:hypothetical protein